MREAEFWYFLPRLSMFTLASRVALTSTKLHCFLVVFWVHTYRSVEDTSQTTGSSMVGSRLRDSNRSCCGEMFGWRVLRVLRSTWQTGLEEVQLKRCRRSSVWCWQSLQEVSCCCNILLILLCVGSRLWRSLHNKEIWSDSRPFSLASLHDFSQSFWGCWSSALHLI